MFTRYLGDTLVPLLRGNISNIDYIYESYVMDLKYIYMFHQLPI